VRYNHQDARVYGNNNVVRHGNTITRNERQHPSFFLIVLTAMAGATLTGQAVDFIKSLQMRML
jgi:hypothetical protein